MKNLILILFLFFGFVSVGQQMMPVSEWRASDGEGNAAYGKGLFWYRLYRSIEPIYGKDYKYSVHFISNSYYDYYNGQVYRTKTFIPRISITVYGMPVENELYGAYEFWLVFMGDLENGKGFEGAVFYSPITTINAFNMYWADPEPY